MKNKILIICFLCFVFALFKNNLFAQYATNLTVTDIEQSLGKKMKANASALLTELNRAYFNEKIPQLAEIQGISKGGKNNILSMWEMTPFRCIETEIIERCLKTPTGYQVRNIPMFLKDMSENEAEKEIAINFDKSGTIEGIYFTLDLNDYKAIMMSEDNDVIDPRCRTAILDFVEKFRTAYNSKDIDLLAKVYSDDVLIITGKVVKQINPKEYIDKLRSIFKNNSKINVEFDSIEVVQHPKFPDIYGLTIKQSWNTTNYSDKGYCFFLLDFTDSKNMQIQVRIWQPEKLNGKQLLEDEIFKLNDFDVRNK